MEEESKEKGNIPIPVDRRYSFTNIWMFSITR
jgi:hypothetical protein